MTNDQPNHGSNQESVNQEIDERNAGRLIAFGVISSIIVLIFIGIIVVGVLIARNQNNSPAADPNSPYGVISRQLPSAKFTTPDQVLPPTLGRFTRGGVAGGMDSFSATYVNGKDKIVIKGGQAVSIVAAQALIQNVISLNGAVKNQQTDIKTFRWSYYLDDRAPTTIHFAWSHDFWYWDIVAPSQAILDEFMTAFKY